MILNSGGAIHSLFDQNNVPKGPLRIWLKNENYPRFAISRSMDDFCVSSVYVIAQSEISEYNVS